MAQIACPAGESSLGCGCVRSSLSRSTGVGWRRTRIRVELGAAWVQPACADCWTSAAVDGAGAGAGAVAERSRSAGLRLMPDTVRPGSPTAPLRANGMLSASGLPVVRTGAAALAGTSKRSPGIAVLLQDGRAILDFDPCGIGGSQDHSLGSRGRRGWGHFSNLGANDIGFGCGGLVGLERAVVGPGQSQHTSNSSASARIPAPLAWSAPDAPLKTSGWA